MLSFLSVLLFAGACAQGLGDGVTKARPETEFTPMKLDLRLTCDSPQIAGEALTCDVVLFADPSGGPAIVPRSWPPFRTGPPPEIVIRFSARDPSGVERWLEIAPEAGRGRYHLDLPLSEGSLLHLLPGEAHGWRYSLNRKDWLLPRVSGEYRIAAELTLRLRERDSDGRLSPGLEAMLKDHPELVPRVVPDGVWRSNEVSIRVSAPAD